MQGVLATDQSTRRTGVGQDRRECTREMGKRFSQGRETRRRREIYVTNSPSNVTLRSTSHNYSAVVMTERFHMCSGDNKQVTFAGDRHLFSVPPSATA